MPLAAQTRLGPYEILEPIGAGGMGEVYKARDTRLGREVAIKISAERFSDRFEREARAVAALNHPNICTLHDVGPNYLVLELVEGPTLAERIAAGPIPLTESVQIARQLAEALEAAHDRGIIHRDLKPANVKLTHDGAIKVLDFGLAASTQPAAGESDPEKSPTVIMTATAAGAILGTAGYMAPEQAKGKKVDARADIWAFGVVLYETLTGKRFVIDESDFDSLPAATPSSIRTLLRRCLTKDPRQRLQAIGEARIAIDDDTPAPEPVRTPSRMRALPWALAVAASGVALWGWLRPAPDVSRPVLRLTMPLPGAWAFSSLHMSPDGSRLAYSGGPDGPIYIRQFDELAGKPIAGGEHGGRPMFSPDGQWVAFFSEGKIKKIPVNGGAPFSVADSQLTDAQHNPFGLVWLRDNSLVFTRGFGLVRVPAAGGEATPLIAPEEQYRAYTALDALPDGRNLLFAVLRGGQRVADLQILDLKTGRKKALLEISGGGFSKYAHTEPRKGTGHIVYQQGNSWFAVAFNPARLEVTGSPFPVLEGISRRSGQAIATFSESGTLVYVPATAEQEHRSTLMWVDRSGLAKPLAAPPEGYVSPAISPDGGRVALQFLAGPQTPGNHIAVFDLARGTLTRLTSTGNNVLPIWTPDGKRLTYRAVAFGIAGWIATIPADGSGPAVPLLRESGFRVAHSWSPDGKLLVGGGGQQLWLLSAPSGFSGETTVKPLIDSPSQKLDSRISPDGHWIAYGSDESGRSEIYVQPFPGLGERWTISVDGGSGARWSRDGRELFYRNVDKVMAVDIQTTPRFRAGVPKLLFEGRYEPGYDVAPDGQRFLMVKPDPAQQGRAVEAHVVLNWFEEVRRRGANAK